MGRRMLRCRNRCCSGPKDGALGQLTREGGLVLDASVRSFRAYLDTRRAVVACPHCGTLRDFRGAAIYGADTD